MNWWYMRHGIRFLWIILSLYVGHWSEIVTVTANKDSRIDSKQFWYGSIELLLAVAFLVWYLYFNAPLCTRIFAIILYTCSTICFASAYLYVYQLWSIPLMFVLANGLASTLVLLPPYDEPNPKEVDKKML